MIVFCLERNYFYLIFLIKRNINNLLKKIIKNTSLFIKIVESYSRLLIYLLIMFSINDMDQIIPLLKKNKREFTKPLEISTN